MKGPVWTQEMVDAQNRRDFSKRPGAVARKPQVAAETISNDNNPQDTRQTPKLERHPRHEPLEASEGEEGHPGRVHIRFVSVRKRLCDPDNLSEKWLLDCLRYVGAIDGDEPDKITLETTQRKAEKGEEEHTVIDITTGWEVTQLQGSAIL